ncbi:MAG: Gfo/Idh/MocA family oxidoreductase [Chryseolinea sp.]
MYKVNIFGAGSIGNHLAHAFRGKNWDVTLSDIDPKALERTKNDIYKSRYGAWDEKIRLADSREIMNDPADIVFIGTPPHTHMQIALSVLKNFTPKILLIEKPLCGPDLNQCQELYEAIKSQKVTALVGYNHTLAKSAVQMEEFIKKGTIGSIETISCRTREHWGGIFKAHPWLNGPQDTYLGFYEKGGGATGEHSHGINLWQHFSHIVGQGKIIEVNATLDIQKNGGSLYDKLGIASFRTEKGIVGDLIQDVVTNPPEKLARVQGSDGFAEMRINYNSEGDAVITSDKNTVPIVTIIPKKRPDDFKCEADHIEELLASKTSASPISIERGLDTMMIIAAIFKSHASKRTVEIDWTKGYVPEAIK